MSVVQSIEDIGPSKKELKIEVPAAAVDAETARVVKDYGRKLKIPGFRPGKVPSGVVRQRFRQDIDREVVERLVPRFWSQAETEAGLDPITPPELAGVEERTEGEPLVFTAQVEVRPEIEIGDLSGFEIPDPPAESTEEEIDAALEDLRRRAGGWTTVERAAGQGDLVSVEIEEVTPGKPEPEEGAEPDRVDVEVGAPQVWEELSLALSGLSAGQKGEFSRMHDEQGEVRERSFKLNVQEVKERELPDVDDALAREVGHFETLAELTDALRERLTAQKTSERNEARERALLDQLRARFPVAVPEGVVNRETESMVREYAESLARQGVDVENAGLDWRAVAEQARPGAEKQAHARLVLDAVAKKEGIAVSDDELDAFLARLASQEGGSPAALRRTLAKDGRLEAVRLRLRRGKTVRRLLGEEEPESPAATGGASPHGNTSGAGGVEEGDGGEAAAESGT
jgi:trigger factor